ncbi:MAG: HAD family phosphatase, partial [Paracoccaceae bacterium]
MSDIRAVVFDIGNVLIGWQPEQFYDGAIGREQRLALFGEVDLFGMNERIDLGADFRQTVYDFADMHPEWREQIRLWHDNWIEMATPVIEHSVHLLQALRRINVPVFALSNFGVGSLAVAQ